MQNEQNGHRQIISENLTNTISETFFDDLGFEISKGKVRDIYSSKQNENMILISTDRVSAFDRIIGFIPYKGQVISQISLWWFNETKHILPNHIIACPDPNVIVVKKCQIFPIEFVVRGYITGITSTSMWTHYSSGVRNYCGITLPDGLIQNQILDYPILTPTTKETVHDQLISEKQIIETNLMSKEDYSYCSKKALELFSFGQKISKKHGLILVDTKYEFGKDKEGIKLFKNSFLFFQVILLLLMKFTHQTVQDTGSLLLIKIYLNQIFLLKT